jgi:hypothetical protein
MSPRAEVMQVFSAAARCHQRKGYDCRVGNPFFRAGKFSEKTASTRR